MASVAIGWVKTTYESNHGGEFANQEIINSTLGGLTQIVAFHIVISRPKKEKDLIEF